MAKSRTMHAFQYEKCGGGAETLKYVEIPIPVPKKDEVLLKVEAVALNPADYKIQKGLLRPFLPRKLPFVPVTDVAGEVFEVGPGVNAFKVGDKVLSWLYFTIGGGLAEYVVASVNLTVHRPQEVSAAECSGLPIAGGSALLALKRAGIMFDDTNKFANVLVTAASGGVGHYAVQLAKSANSHVTASCGDRNIGLIKSLGADEVLNYKTPEGASLSSPSGKKYDIVVHCASDIGWSTFKQNLSDEGIVIHLSPRLGDFLQCAANKLTFSKKILVPMMCVPKKEDLQFLMDSVKEGKLKTVIDSKYPFSSAPEAWTKLMDGHATGKIIVEI